MKITRRFLLAFLFLPPLTLSSLGSQAPNRTYTVLVGTYTDKTGSKGIYAFDFDPSTGKLTPKGLAAETPNPSWIAVHPNGKWIYAANESGKQSTISAFSLDDKKANLALLNQLPSEGEDPCYLSFDKSGKYLFVANYTSGTVAVFPILRDGKLGAPTSVVRDAGPLGPNKQRQEGPHAHWVGAHGNAVFVADLGLDRVLLYRFDPVNGALRKAPAPDARHPFFSKDLDLYPGTGPRHVAISSSKTGHGLVYVLGELDSTVSVFITTIEGNYSGLPGQKITMLPTEFTGRNDAAEIAVHPSGKWLFASNRGHDSIAVFAIDPQKGTLTPSGDFSTGGKEPRHFALDPTDQFLLAENQYSNNIVVFRIDPVSGALTQISTTNNIPSPVCLAFLP
jgi:6-phosphogluconolactonase